MRRYGIWEMGLIGRYGDLHHNTDLAGKPHRMQPPGHSPSRPEQESPKPNKNQKIGTVKKKRSKKSIQNH